MNVKCAEPVSNYNKLPVIDVAGIKNSCLTGWPAIGQHLEQRLASSTNSQQRVIVFECYHGVLDDEIVPSLQSHLGATYFFSGDCMLPETEIDELVFPDVTDDEIFGYMTSLTLDDFFDKQKIARVREAIRGTQGTVAVYGPGASFICPEADVLVYLDLARWEIQQRFRKNLVGNLGADNKQLRPSLKYKRAYFVDWRVCDRLKKEQMERWDFVLDTNQAHVPKLVYGNAIREAYRQAAARPFRVVPFFDPGPWGGQWMKEVCNLDRESPNFAWCFDCVPEENSLLFRFEDTIVETPAINAVFYQPEALLGRDVRARFGDEFPIRFDFLDTMGGGNLSLQVHPTTDYIKEAFGMNYTQDESYYLLDAANDACVYLGLKEGISTDEMLTDLNAAHSNGLHFDADKYIQKWPAKKHDHMLIPAGTVHCSGANSMVLEISATPYIFTFKLWDWNRLGLDGRPRPINLEHGKAVIDWKRTTNWVRKELINAVEPIASGDGWREERTGLHEFEFIETRRHWFSTRVKHQTHGSVNVLNLVEGREAVVESPSNSFAPFVVHYAETFIVPAAVGEYTIRPYGEGDGQECATIKAFVRTAI